MFLKWLDAKVAEQFGAELAKFYLKQSTSTAATKENIKALNKRKKTLEQIEQRLSDFKSKETLNIYKKGKLSKAFVSTLNDASLDSIQANEMVRWLVLRL